MDSAGSVEEQSIHQFGFEKGISVKHLFRFFTNNVYLGQWELARACIQELHAHACVLGKDIHEFVAQVAERPYNLSLRSESVNSPQHLSWLCLTELESKRTGSGDGFVHLKEDLEFQLLLLQAGGGVSKDILRELYSYQREQRQSRAAQPVLPFGSDSLNYIKDVLYSEPALGSAMICHLTFKHKRYDWNNEQLQRVYIKCMEDILNSLQGTKQQHENLMLEDKLYSLLALFNPNTDMKRLGLNDFLTKLVLQADAKDLPLNKNAIYSSLLGRDDPFLIDTYCDIENKVLSNSFTEKHSNGCESRGEPEQIEDEHRHIFAVAVCKDRELAWQQLYLRCLKQEKHFIDFEVEAALQMIKTGQFHNLQQLFIAPELKVLKPMVLLMGWKYCHSCTSARNLLTVLWNEKEDEIPSALQQACKRLSYQVDLVQWCLEKASPLMKASGSTSALKENLTDMFQSLETHSVLYMLHHATHLSQLEEQEVLDIIQKSPVLDYQVGKEAPVVLKKEKSVRFNLDDDDGGVKEQVEPLPLSMEHLRDMAVYRSYCVIRCFMDAIAAGANLNLKVDHVPKRRQILSSLSSEEQSVEMDNENKDSSENQSSQRHILRSLRSVDSKVPWDRDPKAHLETNDLQKHYAEHVMKNLNHGRQLLGSIHPLTYRVEIIENLFSLLFVTHEHIAEVYSESGEELPELGSPNTTVDWRDVSTISEEHSFRADMEASCEQTVLSDTPDQAVEALELQSQINYAAGYDVPFEDSSTAIVSPTKAEGPLEKSRLLQLKNRLISHDKNLDHKKQTHTSGNTSAFSTSSSTSSPKLGFLMNEYLVRDILSVLKDCVVDLKAAKFAVQGQRLRQSGISAIGSHRHPGDLDSAESSISKELEFEMSKWVQSSVRNDTLQKHISRLDQYISEAQWRYQLVSSATIPTVVGQLASGVTQVEDTDSSEDLDGTRDADEEEHQKSKNRRSRIKRTKRESTASGKESSKSGMDSGDILDDGNASGTGRSRRNTKRKKMKSFGKLSISQMRKDKSIVTKMLSSHDALLVMSLRRGNYSQAQQVIKLFSLQGEATASEVVFAEQYEGALTKLQSFQSHGSEAFTKPSASTRQGLGAVRKAAEAGVAKMTISGIVDQLLLSQNLPQFNQDLLEAVKSQGASSMFSSHIKAEDIPCMIMLDLACCGCKSWETCSSMLTMANKRLNGEGNTRHVHLGDSSKDAVKSSKHEVQLKGMMGFLDQLTKLHTQGTTEGMAPQGKVEGSTMYVKQSANQCLTSAALPLDLTSFQLYFAAVMDLDKGVEGVEKALENAARLERKAAFSGKKKVKLKPVTHSSMKLLMTHHKQLVPVAGLQAYFLRDQNMSSNTNYLFTLYNHVKQLAFLVAECESIETVDPRGNYFKMLQEGPTQILGKLMFGKKMPPTRLEVVAKKMKLNLTRVIVKNCCPDIPCRYPVAGVMQGQVLKDGKLILNASEVCPAEVRHPEIVVRELLTRMIKIMKEQATQATGSHIFNVAAAKSVVRTTEYREIVKGTKELKWVDLTLLDEKNERRCFFVNVLNLMYILVYLYEVEKQIREEAMGRPRGASFSSSQDCRSSSDIVIIPTTPFDQLAFQCKMSFYVGQLGPVSLFDVHYVICHQGLNPPFKMDGLIADRVQALDHSDPWYKYSPPPDPRLIFVISEGCQSSPPLQVLTPDLVSNQLKAAMTDYFIHNIEAKKEEKMVIIPQLLVWYRQNFASDGSNSTIAVYEGLLQFIANFATGGLYEKLRALLELGDDGTSKKEHDGIATKKELPFKVIEGAFDYTFCYTFEFSENSSRQFDLSSSSKHRRRSSLPPELENSSGSMTSSSQGLLNQDGFDKATFRLTPVTLEYLKSSSSLVATLVSLVCADEMDDIEQHIKEDFFGSANSNSTDSGLSMVDIKSYRYQKLTTEFSVLHRHILGHIEPIIAARNPEIRHGGDPLLKFSSDSYNSSIKTCILALQEGQQFKWLLANVLSEVLNEKNWDVILEVLDCIPVEYLHKQPDLMNFKDYVLCCAAKEQAEPPPSPSMVSIGSATNISLGNGSTRGVACEKWHYLLQINRPDTQAREVMCTLKKWNVNDCVTLLEHCVAREIENVELLKAVRNKLQELRVYQRITEHAKNKQIKSSMRTRVESFSGMLELNFDKLEELGSWTVVATLSDSEPEPIFRLLISSQDFETARAWSNMHNVGETMKKEIEECHISFLLDQDNANMPNVLQALEDLKQKSVKFCYGICQNLLEKLLQQQHKLFLAQFLLSHLGAELGQRKKDEMLVLCMGSKALLCLPDHVRAEYDHLALCPKLLLEQLLMNMKVDWASKAYESMQADYNHLSDKSLGCSLKEFDGLIAEYANKALEFPVVQIEDERSRSDSATSVSTVNPTDSPSLLHNTSFSDLTFRRYPRTASLASLVSRSPTDILSSGVSAGSGYGVKEGTDLISSYYSPSGQFLLPAEPPAKDKWVADMAVSICMVCKIERFSMFVRRHHCRRCGRVVCYACSARTTNINGTKARTCDDCFEAVMGHREGLEKEMLQQRLRDRLSGSAGRMSASPARISVLSRTPENIIEEDNEDDEADINKTVTDQQQQSEFFWQLTQDQTHNKNLREDFYYEHAPSLPLCLSILALHSDAKECGQLLLNLCDNVSKLLAVKNHAEVDYGLVISMMKYLLFNAKMKFLSCGNSNGIAQCEMYSGRVEMLNLLVASHCKHIPSLQKLTQLETVRRLRDKLIEDERLSLAMEISTKCGLDPAGVWAAWGKACLKTGDFQAAREKFSRCMKAPVDKNQYQQSSNLLNDIVECIENLPGSGINTIQALQASLKSISSLIAEPFVVQNEETNISEQQLQECLYYLKAYGTYGSVISFYRKHGYWMKAVQYLLDKRCSPDVFVECLLVPTLKTGEMAKLQDQLILIDTTLEKWAPYLKAACRYLNKKKYMQVLYQLQLFMKDYVRAAMTCISYSFQHGAVSYGDLYNRLSYIQDAKQHLEDYLEQKLWLVGLKGPAGRRVPDWGGSGGDTLRLLQPPKEVNRYINTISLQVEVTKFLHQYYNAGAAAGELMFPPGKIPTLFGNNNVKVDVVNMVMVAGKNINDGFGIAFRIIQEFQLNATLVYTTVARQLSKQKKFISVKQLLGCIQESGLCDDQSYDEVIGACIRVMADDATEAKEAESLIKLIKSQANKINAYILCGKLKSAYLIAVKEERVEDVQRISGAALRAGQPAVKNICDKWLQQRLKPKK